MLDEITVYLHLYLSINDLSQIIVLQLTWSAKCLLKTYGGIKFASEHAIGYLPLSHIGAMVTGMLESKYYVLSHCLSSYQLA